MARLIPEVDCSGAASDNRAQLLLVGAFGVAVILIAFAGVMNTVAYTDALATQDSTNTVSRDVSAFQEDVRRGIDGVLDRINDGSGDYDTKVRRFGGSVGNWDAATDRQHVTDVTGVSVTVTDTTEGNSITQSTVGNLTNADGEADWQLADSIGDTRRFRLELDRDSLDASCSSSSCYEFVVDGDSTRRVSVSRSAVIIDGPVSGRCQIESDPVTIDIVGGTVNGDRCGPLTVTESASSPYEIRYRNGRNASGTYRLDVQGTIDEDDYDDDGSPSVTPFIYTAEYDIRYRTPRLAYSNDFRIRGDAPDA